MSCFLALCGFVSLPLALFGQWQLDERAAGGRTGGIMLAVATVLFLGGFVQRSVGDGRWPAPWSVGVERSRKLVLAAVGAAASLGSYAFFGANRLTLIGVLLWQGGLALFIGGVIGWGDLVDALKDRLKRVRSIRLSPALANLALATLVGALFRLWDIATLPAEPGVDLPLILLNVEKILDGQWPIFFTLHPGREGLFVYLAAGYVKLFGISYPALRTVSALFGTATIPVVYLVGRQLISGEVGLMAAGLLAVSRWHIILSRTGLRFILMPIFSLLLILALDRALKSWRLLDWAAVGLVLGWGFHTYNAWLIMPAVVLGGWLLRQAVARDWSRSSLSGLLFGLAIAALLLVPLLRFAHDDPEIMSLRVVSRISGKEKALPVDVAELAWTNIARTIRMFNVTGDGVAHINVPLKRQLGLVSAALFLPGVAYLLVHWQQYTPLLLALVVTCLPSALSLAFPEEVPNAGRSSGAVGFACLAAAVPLTLWGSQLRFVPAGWASRRSIFRGAQVILVAATLVSLGVEAVECRADYFERYRFVQPGGNFAISTHLVELIQQYAPRGPVYLEAFPHWYDGNALITQLRLAGIEWDNELSEIHPDRPPLTGQSGPFLILLHPFDNASLYRLRMAFPQAVEFVQVDNYGAPALIGLAVE